MKLFKYSISKLWSQKMIRVSWNLDDLYHVLIKRNWRVWREEISYLQQHKNIVSGNHFQKYELCDTEKDKGYGPKKLFGYKWEALIREWRKLLNGELQKLHSSPSIGQTTNWSRISWVEHEARTPERKTACRDLVEKTEEKRPLGRLMFKSGNIKMDIF